MGKKAIYGAKIYKDVKSEIIYIEDIIKKDKQGLDVHATKYFCPECKKELQLKYTSRTNKDSSFLSTYKGGEHDCDIEKKFTSTKQIEEYTKSKPEVVENSLKNLLNPKASQRSRDQSSNGVEKDSEESQTVNNQTIIERQSKIRIRTLKFNSVSYPQLINLENEILKLWGHIIINKVERNKNDSYTLSCQVSSKQVYFKIYLSGNVAKYSDYKFDKLNDEVYIALLGSVSISEYKNKKYITIFINHSKHIVID